MQALVGLVIRGIVALIGVGALVWFGRWVSTLLPAVV